MIIIQILLIIALFLPRMELLLSKILKLPSRTIEWKNWCQTCFICGNVSKKKRSSEGNLWKLLEKKKRKSKSSKETFYQWRSVFRTRLTLRRERSPWYSSEITKSRSLRRDLGRSNMKTKCFKRRLHHSKMIKKASLLLNRSKCLNSCLSNQRQRRLERSAKGIKLLSSKKMLISY